MCSLKFRKDNLPVVIGRVIKPHGTRGELKIYSETDDPTRYKNIDYLLLCKNGECRRFNIVNVKFRNSQIIVQLGGIYDRDTAELYRNWNVCIKEEDILPKEENEYYIFELMGLKVENVEGAYIGEVVDIYTGGHQDILFIKKENGKKFLLPMVKEFIKEINIGKGYIKVSLIEGFEEF